MASPSNFNQYSPEAQDYAYRQAQRKAQGKRITQYGQSQEFRNAYAALLRDNPEVSRAVQQGNVARVAAMERGFDNVAEYAALSKFAKPSPKANVRNVPMPVGSTAGGTLLSDGTIIRVDPNKALRMSANQIAAQIRSGNIIRPLGPPGVYQSFPTPAPMSRPNPLLTPGQNQSRFTRQPISFNAARTGNVVDFLSTGFFSERQLNKRQKLLNADMEAFNRAYGNRELNEQDYYRAQQLSNELNKRQAQIDFERRALKGSTRKKINRLLFGNALEIDWRTGEPIIDKKTGKPVKGISMVVPFPLVPVNLPASTQLGIKFIGKQRTDAAGKIITDIVFKTSTGRVGVARGITVEQNSRAITFSMGRSAARSIGLPTGKIRLAKVNTFAGVEGTKISQDTLKIRQGMEIMIKGKKVQVGFTERNLQALRQEGRGRVVSAPGRTLTSTRLQIPTGKIIRVANRRINIDDFKSVSAVLTKDDLSLIIGKSITARGNRAKFIGLIKSEKSADDIIRIINNPRTQLQYKKALKSIVGTIAAAESRANVKTLGRLAAMTKAQRALAVGIAAKEIVRGAPAVSITARQATALRSRATTSTQVPQVALRQDARTLAATSQVLRALSTTTTVQQARLVLRQFNVTQQQLKLQVRNLLRQIPRMQLSNSQRAALKRLGINIPIAIPLSIPFGTTLEDVTNLPMRKVRNGGYVVALKKRGRFTIISGILSGNDSRDYGAYVVDNSISRTVKLVPKRGRVLALPGRYKGYFNKIKHKLRGYAIRKGRRVSLDRIYIEKRKYALDTSNEKRDIKR